MPHHQHHPVNCADGSDLCRRARRAAVEGGFDPDFSPAVEDAVRALDARGAGPAATDAADLRGLAWSSIDNPTSRDLDQIEIAERLPRGAIRVRVAIADVDSLVPRGGVIDQRAAENATTLYTGVAVFPMLPDKLSAGLTSLLPGDDHSVVVIEMDIDGEGTIERSAIYRATARNTAKLDYIGIGNWLGGGGPLPEAAESQRLGDQLRLQNEAAMRLLSARKKSGALDFETVEAQPVVVGDQVVDLAVDRMDEARALIENFMIAANVTVARYLDGEGRLGLGRIVRRPARWERIVELAAKHGDRLPAEPDAPALSLFLERRKAEDPQTFADLSLAVVKLLGPGEYEVVRPGASGEGHFGLALPRYAHSTAPNRRYADLIAQRLAKAALDRAPEPYNEEELARLAAHCTERENAAQKVERTMRKVAAALLFGHRVGQVFDAIVTGASQKGTWVRTLHPPVEGRLMHSRHHNGHSLDRADVGDKVRVRLVSTDPDRGFIDFELV